MTECRGRIQHVLEKGVSVLVNDRKWRKHQVSVCTQILTEFDTSQTNTALEFSDILESLVLLLDSLFGSAMLFIAQSPY